MQRLMDFITPTKQLWQNPQLDEALSSFSGFCELLGIGKVRDYLVSHRVHEIADWSTLKLDDEGQAMQAELNERVKVLWSYICSTGDHGADLA
jgi:exportin-5